MTVSVPLGAQLADSDFNWLKQLKTFHGRDVLFWLKHNSFKTVETVLFQFHFVVRTVQSDCALPSKNRSNKKVFFTIKWWYMYETRKGSNNINTAIIR